MKFSFSLSLSPQIDKLITFHSLFYRDNYYKNRKLKHQVNHFFGKEGRKKGRKKERKGGKKEWKERKEGKGKEVDDYRGEEKKGLMIMEEQRKRKRANKGRKWRY